MNAARSAVLALYGSILLAGCAQMSTAYPCPAIAMPPPRLIQPADGATNVSVSTAILVVSGFPSDGTFQLRATGGPVVDLTKGSSNSVGDRPLTGFALQPATAYVVSYTKAPSSGPCGNGEESGADGTFTTQ